MHPCQQCGTQWTCERIADAIWRTYDDVVPNNDYDQCPFHENQGARSLWTCPDCTGTSWTRVIIPYIRLTLLGQPMGLPEGKRRCGCNNCAR